MTSYRFPIVEKRTVASDVVEFGFDTSGSDFSFRPGQYIRVVQEELEGLGLKESYRELSVVNAPGENILRVAFRPSKSPFKQKLLQMQIGQTVTVEGPFGVFTPDMTGQSVVFIAFGIGITPFLSILSSAVELKKTCLIYVHNPDWPAAYKKELDTFHAAGLAVQYATRVNYQHMLQKLLADTDKFYISGPPGAVKDCYQYLTNRNIIKATIVTEEFTGCEEG